jgi:hypothetical protein
MDLSNKYLGMGGVERTEIVFSFFSVRRAYVCICYGDVEDLPATGDIYH